MRVGLLGGTFDPIHIGHLIIAEEARVRLNLDKVLFIPARRSPHKLDEAPCALEHRMRMVELAVADNPYLDVCRLEAERPGPSYTVDTVESLRVAYGPGVDLFFIMGMDSLEGLSRWREPQRLISMVRIVAVGRAGCTVDLRALERELPGIGERLDLLPTLQIGISSTELRRRVREALPIRYQVPAAVEKYIVEHGLYSAECASETGLEGLPSSAEAPCAQEPARP